MSTPSNWCICAVATAIAASAAAGPPIVLFDTGPPLQVNYDSTGTCSYSQLFVGWSSGHVTLSQTERWMAQPFTLAAPPPPAPAWRITDVLAWGFDPGGGTLNLTMHYVVWKRDGAGEGSVPGLLARVVEGSIPMPPIVGAVPETAFMELEANDADFVLPPGDYWLTVYAANDQGVISNFAWYTAASGPDVINNLDNMGEPFAWRSATFPVPGFEFYQLDPCTLIEFGGEHDDLYNAAFTIGGQESAIALSNPERFPTTVNGMPTRLALGDLTGNGFNDVAVVIPDPDPMANGTVEIFANQGNTGMLWNGLASHTTLPVGREPSGIEIADFDNDTMADLAVTNAGDDTIMVFLNDGLGMAFTALPPVATGARPSDLATLDVEEDEDADVDVAVTNEDDDTVLILFNDGAGNLSPSALAGSFGVGDQPVAILADDFDNNKCPDLAGSSQGTVGPSGTVFVGLGLGGGGFDQPEGPYAVGMNPADVSAGDLDMNGDPDLVSSNVDDDTVTILLNDGDGTFTTHSVVPVPSMPRSIDLADLDQDSDFDLVIITTRPDGERELALVRNLVEGGPLDFAPPVFQGVGADANFVRTADMNNDGLTDAITVNNDDTPSGGSVSVLLALQGLAPPCPWDCGGSPDGQIGIEDFLAVLGGWGLPGPCDFDGGGVGITDFLKLLANWGSCP